MDKDKFWFQIDIDTNIINQLGSGQFVNYSIVNIEGFQTQKFDWSCYNNNMIWKDYLFKNLDVYEKLCSDYIHHLKSNSGHFVRQPSYYKSLHTILN